MLAHIAIFSYPCKRPRKVCRTFLVLNDIVRWLRCDVLYTGIGVSKHAVDLRLPRCCTRDDVALGI